MGTGMGTGDIITIPAGTVGTTGTAGPTGIIGTPGTADTAGNYASQPERSDWALA